MKKALMYASVASMIAQFNMENIKLLQELGYQVDVACNFESGSTISSDKVDELKNILNSMQVGYFHIPLSRNITNIKSLWKAYCQTKQLLNAQHYDLIHCHSPIGGIVCRVANKNSNTYCSTKMIYTAHGFHFFKGNNPLKNFLFKTIEKYGAKYTDILITINKEDYEAAKKFKLKKQGTVEYVPGVGIDLDKINSIQGNREKLINELNISKDSILLLSVGELNENKNHRIVIEALPKLPSNIHYLICGIGLLKDSHLDLANQLGVDDRLHLLGYKSNIIETMKSCDIFVFPSKREGLSVALMEAMASGLPCIASKTRGNIDLIQENYTCNLDNFSNCLSNILIGDKNLYSQGQYNKLNINKFSLYAVQKKIKQIYCKELI